MVHQEQALTSFQAGKNCCQAVVEAYCEEMGISEEEAHLLGASYGGGNYQGLCGALAGTYIVANALEGTLDESDPAKCQADKAGNRIVAMTQAFEQTCGSLYCGKLIDNRPCLEYFRRALDILEEHLAE